jgi:hypothetical protein
MEKIGMTKSDTNQSKANALLTPSTESVADILEREQDTLIHEWLALVEEQADLMSIPLSYEARTGHLPHLLDDIVVRLRLAAGTTASISVAASRQGDLRLKQGYSVAMVVEESRLLQVCLFATLHKNSNRLEYNKLLPEIVTIADEVDAQLKQQVLHYVPVDIIKNKLVH